MEEKKSKERGSSQKPDGPKIDKSLLVKEKGIKKHNQVGETGRLQLSKGVQKEGKNRGERYFKKGFGAARIVRTPTPGKGRKRKKEGKYVNKPYCGG